MTQFCKKILITCICLLPTSVFAADNTPEVKPPVVIQTVEAAPPAAPPQPATDVQKTRLGYVDVARIAAESERGKALKAMLNTKKEALQGKIDTKRKALEKLKTSIGAKIETMTPQQRDAKSKEFKKKFEEFQSFAQTSEDELMKLQGQETNKLFDAIEQASVTHGKSGGFAVIVIKKELLYVGSSVDAQDVTDALITALNQADIKK